MNSNYLLFLVIMAIAIIGVGTVAASDIDGATDVNTDMENIVIDDINDIDSISDIDNDENVVIDENTDFENDSIDEVIIEDDETPATEDICGNSTVDEEVVVEKGNQTYNDLMILFNHKEGFDKLDLYGILNTYLDILDLYSRGQPTKNIATEYNMTTAQIQSLANRHYPSIEGDSVANEIFNLYGSYTLEEISEKTGLSEDTVVAKIRQIRAENYGEFFRKILFKRDNISKEEGNLDLIIKY